MLVVRSVDDAPRLSMRGPEVGREHLPAEFTMSARDVEGDSFTYQYDCGDGSFTVTETPVFTCVWGGQGKDAVVRGRAVDARGASSTVTMRVPVRNQRPMVTLPGDLGTLPHTWAEPGLHKVTVRVAEAGGATGSSFTFASVID